MTSTTDRVCAALGRGLLAGLVGTAAMTVSSTIEAKASGRGASTPPAPGSAARSGPTSFFCPSNASSVVGIKPTDAAGEARLNSIAHWGYGTTWGIARGALDLLRLRGRVASLVHFCAVLGAEQILLPALGVSKPTPSYGAAAFATDTLHHGVYAVTTGLAYDYLADR